MAETGSSGTQTVMPLGEALAYAERCRCENRLIEAESVCRRILDAQPNLPEARHLLGVILHQAGRQAEAIEQIRRAAANAPDNALIHANLGEMYRLAGALKKAVEEGRRATSIDPGAAVAWSNLGAALYELKDYEDAARAHRRAIAADPNFAQAHTNLGNALHGLKRLDEAVAAYRAAVALDPQSADAWANLGTSLHHNGDYDEAVVCLRRAIALAPDHANAHSGLGILLLMRGDFAEGFSEYEWRLRSTERKGPRFPEKPWRGESLAGKHIYVQAEQGFGDTLQFARYIPLLARRAGKVSFRVHQELAVLMRESLPGVEILGDRGDPAPYDCDIALMSLPHMFGTRYETIPAQIPSLRAPVEAIARWQARLASMQGLRVGLIWAGNPEHTNDVRRSLDVAHLAPLLKLPGVSFASLQFGARGADLKKLGPGAKKVLDFSRDLGDFANTAGLMTGLDLVISIDSSGAHLAGSLGRPLWVLTSWVADWRWRLEREDNSWYPNARLFRQKQDEDWAAVIARVAHALAATASGDPAQLTPFLGEGRRRAENAAAIVDVEAQRSSRSQPAHEVVNVGHLLAMAEQRRRARLLADAADFCQRAAAIEPGNAEAAHLLGLIAHEAGKLSEAIAHLRRAIALAPETALYHANLGEMCRLAGLTDEAIAGGRRAIELQPDNAGAQSNLGIALFDRNLYDEALKYLDRAVALQPDFAQAHSNRGNALQRLKRFGEAEHAYRRSLELEPRFADAWNNLGTCLRELKRFGEAEAAYRKALEQKPNDPDVLDSLALALKDLERLDEAEATFRAALAIESRSDKIFVHYGATLIDMRRHDEAAAMAERALKLNPRSHDAINLLGRAAFAEEQPERALACFRQALALNPDLADAYNNMGNALKDLGRLDEARAAYLKALELDPDVTGVYVNLADSVKFSPDDPHLAHMEKLAAKPDGLSPTDRLQLDFALGKAYADLQDFPRSFAHLLKGNAGKRATIAYDERAALAFFDRIETVFSRELIAAKSGFGDPSPRPIFVLGMPRSGTTLVEQIIASHPMAHGAGELMALHDVVGEAEASGPAFPELISSCEPSVLRRLSQGYLDKVQRVAPEGARVTDKMPSNYYYLGLIHLALPNAKIIHVVRDPMDTCLSCFSKLFSAEQNHTYDLGELGRYYRRYERLMQHWRQVLPPSAFVDIQYEDMVDHVEREARRLLDFCGLPWDDRCLAFHETDRPVRTASATQVRQPIYRSAIGRWRVYEDGLGPLRQALGQN
ncbi:tetratricopeptide repeat protein [uncultured Rhodoblastus sp.]|uniref:tetratricopeptide repeat protein n=1 Tax=uncultured Rhodoblastus sp. TaxID=543037 RepID=UPI0025F7E1E9|nr:tetratricopeptide repeat protein [uncultured Rhodoblastus sp.]